VAFIVHVLRMNLRDGAVHMAGVGVPAHVIADRDFFIIGGPFAATVLPNRFTLFAVLRRPDLDVHPQ
jgi:hypothetical protein